MARACVRLSSIASGAPPLGCFGGPPLATAKLPGTHLLSFDCAALPAELTRAVPNGTATLHASPDEDLGAEFAVVPQSVDFSARLVAPEEVKIYPNLVRADDDGQRVHWRDLETACIPLYAYSGRSLPSVSDLLEFGTPRVHDWLRSLGWKPEWRYNGNFDKRSSAAAEYAQLWWQDRYGNSERPRTLWSLPKARTFAMLGGWPAQLIDEPLPKGQLVETLFADVEPRRHVIFSEEGGFAVCEETTLPGACSHWRGNG